MDVLDKNVAAISAQISKMLEKLSDFT
jgi:hypothetical protein